MNETLLDLAVTAPAAAATIVVVVLFLKFLRDERVSRDKVQERFSATIEKLSVPITELTLEVRMLREEHDRSTP